MKVFVLIILLWISFQLCHAHREDSYFLTGTMGGAEVGVRIDENGDNAMMRFFKLGELEETVLDGTKDIQGQFVFRSQSSDTALHIFLHETALNIWSGTCVGSVCGTGVIKLKPIDVHKIEHPYVEVVLKYKLDPYTALRTKSVKFIPLSTSRQKGGYKTVSVKDNLANVSSIRIKMGRKKIQAESINAFLVAEHLKHIQNALSCGVKEKPVYEVSYDVHVITNNYISFSESITTNCLGGKVNTEVQNFNKWLSSGNDIMLEHILWFGENGKNDIRYGSQEWHQYRYKVFGDSLLSIMLQLYPERIQKTGAKSCDYSNVKGWQFPKWHLLPRGIYFEYAVLSKDVECNRPDWTVVPWKKIKKYRINTSSHE